MTSPLYSLLNLFESSCSYLVEITRTAGHDPDTWVNEWVWIERRHAMTLQPVKDGKGVIFEEGNLLLDNQRGEMHWSNGRSVVLTRRDTQAFPFSARGLLELHLS